MKTYAKFVRQAMNPFEYIRCGSVGEVCAAIDAHAGDCRILAGGTDLLLELRRPGNRGPKAIVDIGSVTPFKGIEASDGTVRIGPLATHADISRSEVLRCKAGFLADAAASIGSPQIRNRGTIGGNIMNAAACADTVPPLVALGARLTLTSGKGERTVAMSDFFEKPYRTRAQDNEVLTSIRFSPLPSGARTVFLKLGRRNAMSIARLSVAVILVFDGEGVILEARIVPGAALPVWMRIMEAESKLIGSRPSEKLFEDAGRKVSEVMVRIGGRRWSTEYKEPVLGTLVERALSCAAHDFLKTP